MEKGKKLINLIIIIIGLFAEISFSQETDVVIFQHNIPNSAIELRNEGISLFKLGNCEAAITKFEKSLFIKNDFYEAQLNLATVKSIIFTSTKKDIYFDESLSAFQKAEDIANTYHINDSKLYSNMAWLYYSKALATHTFQYKTREKYFNESESLNMKSLKINPDNYEAQNTLGAIYELGGDVEESVKYYKMASELGFDQATLNYQRLSSSIIGK